MTGSSSGLTSVVLLLEDNEDDAFFFKRAWKARGGAEKIVWVENGLQAKEILSKQETDTGIPRLIVTDLKMPQCDGFEFLRWLRAQPTLKEIACLIFSSSSESRDQEEAKSLGADGFFTKPGDSKTYATILDQIEGYLAAPENQFKRG